MADPRGSSSPNRRHGTVPSRRRVVGALSTGAILTLAGCVDAGSNSVGEADAESGDPTADGGSNDRDLPSIADHPIDERVPFETDHQCGVCRMPVTEYPEWMGQLAHEDATGVFVCTPGCLFAYAADAEGFGGPADPIVRAWTTEYETTERIDAETAAFALEREGEGGDEPMHPNPRPFADDADAIAYVEAADDLGDGDVIRFDDVDEPIARIYRDARMP